MGIRRKKISDSQKEKIIELLDTETPRQVHERYQGTRGQISLSEIYKIRREKQGRQAGESPIILSKDLTSLLHDWRTRIRFLFLGELLEKYWFGGLLHKLQYLQTEFGGTGKLFDAVQGHHAQSVVGPGRVMLGLESRPAFIELKRIFPQHLVWILEDQWEKNYGKYIESLLTWCRQIRIAIIDGIPAILNSVDEQSRATVEVNIVFVGTVVSCDLLLREIEERPSSLLWYMEAENIRQVRANAISHSSTEVKKFLSTEYDIQAIWEREIIIPSSRGLLDEVKKLDATSNHLRSALAELELNITTS